MQGRLREGKQTYASFLDVQKTYDTVWRDGLWVDMEVVACDCMTSLGALCC